MDCPQVTIITIQNVPLTGLMDKERHDGLTLYAGKV